MPKQPRKTPRKRNTMAKALAAPLFRPRVMKSKKVYSRKTKGENE